MNDKLLNVLKKLSLDEVLIKSAYSEINNIFGIVENSNEDINQVIKPKLIGYLSEKFGYNGFYPIEKGTPVYEQNDRYFFEMKSISKEETVKQFFYKETLKSKIELL